MTERTVTLEGDEPNCCGAGEWVCSPTCSAPKWTALEEATDRENRSRDV